MKQRRGSKHKKSRGEKSVEQNNSTSSSSLWVVVAYSFILRKAKAFYEWICSNGNYDEVPLTDPYFSVPVLPPTTTN
ncbi:hypothetical protein KY290_034325 [Solanum tuberosum]|uniref:Uncharacterized protein n=1 Tax=Solanum tuberosum TaxID=4113 RepID=A0ABQ7U2W5_SOLTU|nr:hypothetical protein KY284_033424 [Solanum tuberosum]KAH0741282.1 hypothetical protein KY290_034325 [Solanum tuberosum]